MKARDVIRILDEAVLARGSAPEFIRSDNGPEFVALAVQERIARRGFKPPSIKPGGPCRYAYSESFNSRFRDEFLNRAAFASVLEAKVLGQQHRQRHNHERPHSSLDCRFLGVARATAEAAIPWSKVTRRPLFSKARERR